MSVTKKIPYLKNCMFIDINKMTDSKKGFFFSVFNPIKIVKYKNLNLIEIRIVATTVENILWRSARLFRRNHGRRPRKNIFDWISFCLSSQVVKIAT